MSNPIGARQLLQALPALLAQTDWPLSQPADAAAALVHTIHIALGFRLISPAAPPRPSGPGDASSGGRGPTSTAAPNEESGDAENGDHDDTQSEATYVNTDTGDTDPEGSGHVEGRLADDWNAHGEGSYVLEYAHEQSSMRFRIRVGRMGGLVQVDAMAAVCSYLPCS